MAASPVDSFGDCAIRPVAAAQVVGGEGVSGGGWSVSWGHTSLAFSLKLRSRIFLPGAKRRFYVGDNLARHVWFGSQAAHSRVQGTGEEETLGGQCGHGSGGSVCHEALSWTMASVSCAPLPAPRGHTSLCTTGAGDAVPIWKLTDEAEIRLPRGRGEELGAFWAEIFSFWKLRR